MATVTNGSTATYTFSTTQTVAFTFDVLERALITVTRAGYQIYGTNISTEQSIGPFVAADVMTITAVGGDVVYTATDYAGPVAPGAGGITSSTWASRGTGTTGDQKLITDFTLAAPALASWDAVRGDWSTIGNAKFHCKLPVSGSSDGTANLAAINATFAAGALVTVAGFTVTFDTGDWYMSGTIQLPVKVRLEGVGPLRDILYSGTMFRQVAGLTTPVISMIGTPSARHYSGQLVNITVYGNGGTTPLGLVYLYHCSYSYSNCLNVHNTSGIGLNLMEPWDMAFYHHRNFYCGSADGVYPAINISRYTSASPADDFANQIFFYYIHCESFAGTAINVSGSNCGQVFVYGGKFESGPGLSQQPYVNFNTAVNVWMFGVDICGNTSTGRAVDSLIKINASNGIHIQASLKCAGTGGTIRTYVDIINSRQVTIDPVWYGVLTEPSSGFVISYDALNTASVKVMGVGGWTGAAVYVDPTKGYFSPSGVWAPGAGGYGTLSASRSLAGSDYEKMYVVTSNPTITATSVAMTGTSKFSVTFDGAMNFADGTATVSDRRQSVTANPTCCLVQTGTTTLLATGTKV